MTLRNVFNWSAALVLVFSVAACGNGGQADQGPPATDTLSSTQERDGLVKVGNKIFSIPSPVQTVLLIRELDAPYAAGLPLSVDSVARYATKDRQALVLGVYGADLAYVSAYKDGQRALKTMKVVEQLSSQLNLTNAFDKELVDSFKRNINNEDSLMRLTGAAFRAADMYLKNDQREDVSTRILAGGWIEGLYLALGQAGGGMDPRVALRLAEQKHALGNLIELLDREGGAAELVASLKDLASTYNQVTLDYQFVEPRLDAANKVTYINSISKAGVTPEVLQEIIRKVRDIRAAIIA